MQGGISWHLTREMLRDDVVMAGPNPFNGQSGVLKRDGTGEYFDDAFSEDDKYILCRSQFWPAKILKLPVCEGC
jgi:hypothetical protein